MSTASGSRVPVRVANLSAGGCYVVLPFAPPAPRARCRILLFLSDDRPTAIDGEIRFTRDAPRGCGIRFLDLTEEAARAIGHAVAHGPRSG